MDVLGISFLTSVYFVSINLIVLFFRLLDTGGIMPTDGNWLVQFLGPLGALALSLFVGWTTWNQLKKVQSDKTELFNRIIQDKDKMIAEKDRQIVSKDHIIEQLTRK